MSDLIGRAALVTGVSRRDGIGFAIAKRLAAAGADLAVAHYVAHDDEQPWGSDDIDLVLAGIREAQRAASQRLFDYSVDLSEAEAAAGLMAEAAAQLRHIDILVCNHARSGGDGALGELTADMLDQHWAVNARSSILLAQEFARQHDGRDGGRIVFFTSGQGLGPMPGEVAYATSKAALAGITLTLADQLAPAGITVNTINPGPVDTGYLSPELLKALEPKLRFGRLGEPDDPARLVAWLVSDDGRWVTGQVLNSEGGFARWG